MVKKVLTAISILALGFLILGCSDQTAKSAMQIQPTELSEKESQIMKLIQSSSNSSAIYDYAVDSEGKTVTITCYELDENGKWILNNGAGSFPLQNATGRIAISFDNLGEGIRVAVQDGDNINATENNSGKNMAMEGMSSATSCSSAESVIEYEKEIPLAMQVFTTKKEIKCSVEFFKQPEEFLKNGYEAVYVVVIKFSDHELV